MQPKVSVIIPVYNVEMYLKECLDSVVNQTLKDIEIICVDDGSTDSSIEIMNEYAKNDSRITILQQKQQYAGVARNKGMKIAKGEYLLFVDSDDYCDKNLLKECYYFAKSRDIDIVVFDYFKLDAATGLITYFKGLNTKNICAEDKNFSFKDIPFTICNTINPTPWNKLIRKEFLQTNNITYADLSTTNDITFATLCALKAKSIAYLQQGFYYYRIGNSDNVTSRKRDNLDNIIKAVFLVYEEAQKLSYFDLVKDSIRRFVAENLFVGLDRYAGDVGSLKYIEYKNKIESILCCHPLFVGLNESISINSNTMKRIMEFKRNGIERNDFRYSLDIIITLTSYPKRIGTIHKVIASLLDQTLPADRIILCLSKEQFPNLDEDLPFYLTEYIGNGLEIRWCDGDLKSHKKYLYSMKEYPYALHITVDDDLVYDRNMIKKLFLSYLEYPEAVSAMRVHLIKLSGEKILPYKDWIKEYNELLYVPSMRLLATSGAGTLFPPNCMSDILFKTEIIEKYCLNADDLWLKTMQVINNTPVVLVNLKQKLKYCEGTQEETLYSVNVVGNDIQLNQVLNYLEKYKVISKQDFIGRISVKENFERKHDTLYECDVVKEHITEIKKSKREIQDNKNGFIANFSTARFDFRNKGQDVVVSECNGKNIVVDKPDWYQKDGKGYVIESIAGSLNLKFVCKGKGVFEFCVRSRDVRRHNNTRIALWLFFTKLIINEKSYIEKEHLFWHDHPFKYKKNVEDGEVINISVEWIPATKQEDMLKILRESQINNSSNQCPDIKCCDPYEEIEILNENLKEIKSGWSFRIGRAITWLPRKIMGRK